VLATDFVTDLTDGLLVGELTKISNSLVRLKIDRG
jgi:hypothetical protein